MQFKLEVIFWTIKSPVLLQKALRFDLYNHSNLYFATFFSIIQYIHPPILIVLPINIYTLIKHQKEVSIKSCILLVWLDALGFQSFQKLH